MNQSKKCARCLDDRSCCPQHSTRLFLKFEGVQILLLFINSLIGKILCAMRFSTPHKHLCEKQDLVLDKFLDYGIYLVFCI